MESASLKSFRKSWQQNSYYISTDARLIPLKELVAAFASKEFYWAQPLPEAAMRDMLGNSLNFGLFECENGALNLSEAKEAGNVAKSDRTSQQSLKFIGLARCVTDSVTFLYLTDVWVDPNYQGKGLGTWLIKCVQEVVEEMPYLRRSMLFTADWKRSVPFYENLMGMNVIETQGGQGLAVMERKGRGHPSFGSTGSGYQ